MIDFISNLNYSKHCIYCEGLDLSIKEPKHHPSYEITTKCNLNCVYCYSKVAVKRGTAPKKGYYGDLNPKVITLSQYGEPLLIGAEGVARIVEGLREIFGDVRIDLQTNGTVDFTPLDGLIDIAMVSLDVSNAKSYKLVTGYDRFHDVLRNLEKALEMDCVVIVRSVHLPKFNDSELVELAKITGEMGVDELFIQPCSVYEDNLNDLMSIGFDIESSERLYDYLKVVCECKEYVNVVIPGCIKVVLDRIVEQIDDPNDLKFVKRRAVANVPKIRREWKFSLH